jgi:hypothetical protein
MRSLILLALALALVTVESAAAGVMEVSYTFNRTDSKIDEDNFSRSLSHTASFAWYFLSMSAIELSYTRGEGQVSGRAAGDASPLKFRTDLKVYGADLVITFAGRESMFQPFIKGGGAWVDKRIFRLNTSVSSEEVLLSETDRNTAVPSFGAGFRLRLTEAFGLRASYDRWRSGVTGNTDIWDSAVRAGVSFMF